MFGGLNAYPTYRQVGLLSSLKSKINLGSILTNTQKTLNIVNQAIPLIYQVKPIISNAKTIFKIIGAVKDDDEKTTNRVKNTRQTTNNNNRNSNSTTQIKNTTNQPIFFI